MNNYQRFYDHVMKYGFKQCPRGLRTTAMFDQSLFFIPGSIYTRPGGNIKVGFIEMLQFISGEFRINTFKKVTPNARLDLFTEQSAYGPRTLQQFDRVIHELQSDKDTRRATLFIANPLDTNETMPCTMSMQFQIMDDRLHTTINMRSSDLIWGLPNDLIQFSGVIQMVANCIGVKVGEGVVNAGNSHVYDRTAMGLYQRFLFSGTFTIPVLSNHQAYVTWANDTLNDVEDWKSIYDYVLILEMEEG